MSESSYQGWTNYPTWAVALWIDNSEPEYDAVTSIAAGYDKAEPQSQWSTVDGELAAWLKEYIEEATPDLGATLHSDLLNYALEQVNWHELARHYLDTAKEMNDGD